MKRKGMIVAAFFMLCVILTTGAYAAAHIISMKRSHTITVGTPTVLDLTISGATEIFAGDVVELKIKPDFAGQTGYNLHITELSGSSIAVDGDSESGSNAVWMFSSAADTGFYGMSAYGTVTPILTYEQMSGQSEVSVYVKLNDAIDAEPYYGTELTVTFQLIAPYQA